MKCQRCHQETDTFTISRFNTQMICKSCEAAERNHPSYQHAIDIERAHVMSGDYNFAGIGLPADLR